MKITCEKLRLFTLMDLHMELVRPNKWTQQIWEVDNNWTLGQHARSIILVLLKI